MFQQVKVIGDAGRGHGEGLGDFAHGQIAFLEHFKDATAGGIAEGFKEEVHSLHN